MTIVPALLEKCPIARRVSALSNFRLNFFFSFLHQAEQSLRQQQCLSGVRRFLLRRAHKTVMSEKCLAY